MVSNAKARQPGSQSQSPYVRWQRQTNVGDGRIRPSGGPCVSARGLWILPCHPERSRWESEARPSAQSKDPYPLNGTTNPSRNSVLIGNGTSSSRSALNSDFLKEGRRSILTGWLMSVTARYYIKQLRGSRVASIGCRCPPPTDDGQPTSSGHFTFSMSPGFQLLLRAASVGP